MATNTRASKKDQSTTRLLVLSLTKQRREGGKGYTHQIYEKHLVRYYDWSDITKDYETLYYYIIM